MFATELRKFDTRQWVDSPSIVRLSFYGLGATVRQDMSVPTGTSQLPVHDVGALTAGATVRVGLNGPSLGVTEVNSRTLITVNNTGSQFSFANGTRLVLTSDPVTAYADSAGSAPVTGGNSIEVNTPGAPPVVWIARPNFDFTIVPAVTFDSVSAVQSFTGNGPSMSAWTHEASGNNRIVLVGVSWQDQLGEESIDSVTYDGAPMTLLGTSSYGAVFYRLSPPTGSRPIVVTWSGTSPKGAVAASVSFANVVSLSAVASATGSGTSPNLTVASTSDRGQIFNLVSAQGMPAPTSLTAGSPLAQRWSGSGGSAGAATLTQGGGATLDTTGASANLGWTLGSSRDWSMIAVALTPVTGRVTIGVAGGISVGVHYVDARNYSQLQSALDDVSVGGTVMCPNGDFIVQSGGVIVRKMLTLQGEPGTRLLTYAAAASQQVIRIEPGGKLLEWVTIRDLTLMNAAEPTSPIAGNYGLLCDVPADGSKIGNLTLERVRAKFMGDDGFRLTAYGTNDSYFVFVTMRSCRSEQNRGRGLFLQTANLFEVYGSYFVGNDLDGFRGVNSQIEFHSTGFEGNCLTGDASRISATLNGQLSLLACPISLIGACHVGEFTGNSHPVCRRGIVIEGGGCATIMSNRIVGAGTEDSTHPDARGIFITAGNNSGVTSCSILPNAFVRVKTAIEIDGGAGLAKDCLVAAQRIEDGTGAVLLPTAVTDSGVFTIGRRHYGTGAPMQGMFLPPRENTASNALPNLSDSEAGFILYDVTTKTIRIWTGSAWRPVQLGI